MTKAEPSLDDIAALNALANGITIREPLGVVAGITPPNYPLTMPLYKAAPALATSNTIIIKPSEDASLVAIRLAEIFLEAGLPEGVFNVVTGYGETAGAALANHH